MFEVYCISSSHKLYIRLMENIVVKKKREKFYYVVLYIRTKFSLYNIFKGRERKKKYSREANRFLIK